MPITARTLALARQSKAYTTATVDRYTHQIIRAWAQAWDDLAAAFESELADIMKLERWADAMDAERIRQLQRSLSDIVDRRLAELINDTGAQVGSTARTIANQIIAETAAILESQIDPSHWPGFVRPVPIEALDWVAERTTQQITVRHYYLQQEATAAMKRELMLATAAGDNPRAAAERMITRVEDAFNGGLTRATVIARTEMHDASRAAALEQRKANADVLKGWVWFSDLSDRTCPSCWAMHGSTHPVDEPGPIDHHQGRCTALPVTKSAAELGLAGGDTPGLEPTQADAKAKFEALPEHRQRDILGPDRYEAWKAGRYPMESWPERRQHWDTDDAGVRRRSWRDSIHTSSPPPPTT